MPGYIIRSALLGFCRTFMNQAKGPKVKVIADEFQTCCDILLAFQNVMIPFYQCRFPFKPLEQFRKRFPLLVVATVEEVSQEKYLFWLPVLKE